MVRYRRLPAEDAATGPGCSTIGVRLYIAFTRHPQLAGQSNFAMDASSTAGAYHEYAAWRIDV